MHIIEESTETFSENVISSPNLYQKDAFTSGTKTEFHKVMPPKIGF